MSAVNVNATKGSGGNDFTTAPKPRAAWLTKRRDENRDGNFSQMHYARRGLITEEMGYIAHRERFPRTGSEEVARGRMIIPPTSTT
jgi:phosphomethylpyrimidine synthase